jgi:hypothetical protein
MTRYTSYGLDLSDNQLEKIIRAAQEGKGTTVKVASTAGEGSHKFLLTPTQIEKIKNTNGSTVTLKLSATQLKELEKSGGFLPLLALLPLIFGGLGAASGIAGGVASAVSAAKNSRTAAAALEEQIRHNKEVEQELKSGSGIISDRIENVPFIKKVVPYLRKIGLGLSTCKKIMDGDTACTKSGIYVKQIGQGIYLGPSESFGNGLYLSPFLGQR